MRHHQQNFIWIATNLFIIFTFITIFASATPNIKYILHLSDIHYDHLYTAGSPTNCLTGKWGLRCCQSSSIPLDPPGNASKWGDYNCDTPLVLVEETMKWIKNNLEYDYVFYSGDSNSHHDIEQILDWKDSFQTIDIVTQWLSYLEVPLYSVLGNHDGYPFVDQLWDAVPVLVDVASLWENNTCTNNANITGFAKGGYYQTITNDLGPITGTNCLWFDIHNIMVMINSSYDGGDQLAWAMQYLNGSIHLSHMAPRSGEASDIYTSFMNTVHPRLEFYGHTHLEEFRIIRGMDGTFRVAYITGSIMPDNHYPMFRVYAYDTKSGSVLDYKTYYLNLTQQQQFDDFIGYEILYSAKDAYSLADLSPQSWIDLTQRMSINNTLFQIYCNNMAPPQTVCNPKEILCDIDTNYC